ncbi:MAG: hypothetical protein NTY16_04440 [Deltaproteobacteria bacterium]|nr:hypothetical protein [Deltaproteobacteria bacterium]
MIKIVQFLGIAVIGEFKDGQLFDPRVMSHGENAEGTRIEIKFIPLIGFPKSIDLGSYQFCFEPNDEIKNIYIQARSGLSLVSTPSVN